MEYEKPQLIQAEQFVDHRGKFMPSSLDKKWVQTNVSVSRKGVLRGMHFQADKAAQAKLVRVLHGKVVDIIVDLRDKENNPDYGKVSVFDLYSHDEDGTYPRLYVPKGFAHGFLTLADNSIFEYQVDAPHTPEKDRAVSYKSFPVFEEIFEKHKIGEKDLIVSDKDTNAPHLADWESRGENVI